MAMQQERRKEPRDRFNSPVEFYHPGLKRMVTAMGRDISPSGAAVRLPLSVPIIPGQELELRFLPPSKSGQPREPELSGPPRKAQVCRISRLQTVLEGEQIVGFRML